MSERANPLHSNTKSPGLANEAGTKYRSDVNALFYEYFRGKLTLRADIDAWNKMVGIHLHTLQVVIDRRLVGIKFIISGDNDVGDTGRI